MDIFNLNKSRVISAVLIIQLVLSPSMVMALPQGGVVAAGEAAIQNTSATTLNVQQGSDKAIINWQGFDIADGEQVSFKLPSGNSVTLNRVVGGDLSNIFGTLSSNGKLFLINPQGVLFGESAMVNVESLLTTSSDISDTNFMSGDFDFNIPGSTHARIENAGNISVADTGFAAFVAPSVANSGVIQANLGTVNLSSGNLFTVDLYGDGLINFAMGEGAEISTPVLDSEGNPVAALVENSGEIIADGGSVLLTARAAEGVVENVVNMDGVIQAQTAELKNGTIILSGGDHGVVSLSGELDVSGKNETGGMVKALGDIVGLFESASIDASGINGGGTVLVGGNYQGNGEEQNATFTYVGPDSSINASALENGDGGTVIVWADDTTEFFGSIAARGGEHGGDGGFVETSGKNTLDFTGGRVFAGARIGNGGNWLLDPEYVEINAVEADSIENTLTNGSDVTVTSDSYIKLNRDITMPIGANTGGERTLIFDALDNVTIDASIGVGYSGEYDGWLKVEIDAPTVDINAGISPFGYKDGSGWGNGVHIRSSRATNINSSGSIYAAWIDIDGDLNVDSGGILRVHTGTIWLDGEYMDIAGSVYTSTGSYTGGKINIHANDLDFDNGSITAADSITIAPYLSAFGGGSSLSFVDTETGGGQLVINSTELGNLSSKKVIFGDINSTGSTITVDHAVAVTDADISLIADGAINLGANVTGSTNVEINSNSAITQTAGTVTATNLGIRASTVSLPNQSDVAVLAADISGSGFSYSDANTLSIGTVGSVSGIITQGGDIAVTAVDDLSVDQSVDANGGNVTLSSSAGDLDLAANISGTDIVLDASNAINQTAGTVTATNLGISASTVSLPNQSDVAVLAADISDSGFSYSDANTLSIGTVGSISGITTQGGDIAVTAVDDLSVDQTVNANGGDVTLSSSAGELDLAASISGTDVVLDASNAITQTAGTVTATNLGISAGTVSLPNQSDVAVLAADISGSGFSYSDANTLSIGTVGSISGITTQGGDIAVTAADDLNIDQMVDANGGNVTLTSSGGGDLDLAANISGTDVVLDASNAINQTAGTVMASNLGLRAATLTLPNQSDVAVLAADISGSGFSYSDANTLSIGTVGSISGITTQGGDIAVTAADDLSVDQAVDANAGNVTLTSSGGDLDLAANINGTDVVLDASNAITQTAGTVKATNLGISASTVSLPNQSDVAVLAADISGSGFSYSDANTLSIGTVGSISGITTQGGNIAVTAADDLSVDQAVDANAGNVTLTSSGGDLDLAANISGTDVVLDASNAINQIAGTVTASNLGLRAATLTLPNQSDVAVLAADISGSGFSYSDANTLSIGTVGSISGITTQGGDIAVTAVDDLSVDQAMDANGGNVSLTSSVAALDLAANISGTDVVLDASNAINQTAGTVTATNLGISASTVSLPNQSDVAVLAAEITGSGFSYSDANTLSIGTVGSISGITTQGGDIAVTAADDLSVDQAVEANGGDVSLTSSGGDLDLAANISGTDVVLDASNAINQTAGTVTATNLGISASTVSLPNQSDVAVLAADISGSGFSYSDANTLSIGTVGSVSGIITQGGDIAVTAVDDLSVDQSVDANGGNVTLSSSAGDLDLAANISGTDIVLDASNAINQTAGTVTATNLGISASTVSLPNQSDVAVLAADISDSGFSYSDANTLSIGTVGSISGITTQGGDIAVTAVDDLSVDQTVNANGGDVTLSSSAGELDLAASISGTDVVLDASNAITQTAGTVTATNLGISAGTVSLPNQSDVAVLAADISGSGFSYSDANTLSIGTVGSISGITTQGGDIAVTAADDLNIDQMVDANGGNVTLTSSGGGDLDLAANISGTDVVLDASNAINQTAGTVMASNLGLRAATLTLPNQSDVAVLAADISGSGFSYSDANTLSIGTVGSISGITTQGGDIAVTAADDLSVDQAVDANAGNVTLTSSGGDLDLAANINGTDVVLDASNAITQTAGTVKATNLGISASTVSLPNQSDVAVLAADISGSGFSYSDANTLSIGTVGSISGITTQGGDIAVTAADDLSVDQVVDANGGNVTLNSSAANLDLAANISGTDIVLDASNAIIQTSGTIDANALGLRATSYTFTDVSDIDELAANISGQSFSYQDDNDLTIASVGDIQGITTQNADITLEAQGQLQVISGLSAGSSDITITAETVDFGGGNANVSGTGQLLLQPNQDNASIGIGGGAGDFQLSQNSLDALEDGFEVITVGRQSGSHQIHVETTTVSDALILRAPVAGGEIYIDGVVNGADDASITLLGPGATTYISDDIITSGEAIYIDDSVVLLGDVVLDSTNNGAVAGSDITITGQITGGNALSLVAGDGDISLVGVGEEDTPLSNFAATGSTVVLDTVTADYIYLFDSDYVTGTLNATNFLRFNNVPAFDVSASVSGVTGSLLSCAVPVTPVTGLQSMNGTEVTPLVLSLDSIANYLGGNSRMREDSDEDESSPASEAFGQVVASSKGMNVFSKDYRLLGKEGPLAPAFEDSPYIRDGFWESDLGIRR